MRLPVVALLIAVVFSWSGAAFGDQPPISLSIKDATLRETAEALGKAVGVPMSLTSFPRGLGEPAPSAKRYTLDAKGTYWEVFGALSRQGPLRLTQSINGSTVLSEDEGGWVNFQTFGDLAAMVGDIRFVETVNLQPEPPSPVGRRGRAALDPALGKLSIQITAALDPRVRLVHIREPNVLRAVDDAGNVLAQNGTWPAIIVLQGTPTHDKTATVTLTIPQRPGTKIASLEGELPCEIIMDERSFEIAELPTMIGQDYQGPGSRIHVDTVVADDRQIRVTGTAQGGGLLFIRDSEGRVVNAGTNLTVGRPFTILAPIGSSKPPYKAVIVAGVAQRQSLLFQFKDLPLPLPRQ